MAEVVVDHNWHRPRTSHYPWDEWLDGQVHKLLRGEDFKVAPQSLVRSAHYAARMRGKRVRTSAEGVDVLYVQALSEGGQP